MAAERANLENLLQQTETDLLNSLRQVEHDIESKEDQYIRVTWPHGNVLRGWDGFGRRVERTDKAVTGNGSGVATGAPKHRKARASDRIFSLSSSTSIFRKQNPFAVIQRPITNKKKKKR